MSKRVVTFSDFSGGEYGTIGSRKAGELDIGMFTASNMRVYRDGSIGPRAGAKNLGFSGLGSGGIKALAYRPFGSTEVFMVIGNRVYVAPAGGGVAAAGGTLAVTPSEIIRIGETTRRLNSLTYFTVYGDHVYSANSAGAVTQVTAAGGHALELYGDRLILGGTSTVAQRLFYSDAADFTTWGIGSFFDVGYEYPAYHMLAHRGGLTVLAQAGLWRVTGVPSVDESVRESSKSLAANLGACVLDGDNIVYIPNARTAPIRFDGGVPDDLRWAHLEWTQVGQTCGGAYAPYNDDIIFMSGIDNKALLRTNDAWTVHTFGINLSTAVSRALADKFMFADTTSTPIIYGFDTSIDRPGFTSDSYASPGDGSTTPVSAYLYLPEYRDPSGREIRVSKVVVDFQKWSTGSASTNHFDLTVQAITPMGTAGHITSSTYSFDEAGASSSTSGTLDRREFSMGEQGYGGAFEIHLDAIRGVAIRSINVVVDVEDTRIL